jgi:creatinine amidohydrolase
MPETADDIVTMTWEDAEDSFADADAVVLPLGSIEQHSIHLPVSTDTLRAEHLTAKLVEAARDHDLQFVRLPTLPYGYSEHHMNFPGTITLKQDTYTDVLVEIGESLANHGVDRLVMVNCHGGNREPMKLATDRIQRDFGVTVHPIHWTDFAREYLQEEFGEGWGHAGDHETSVIELFRADLVNAEKKKLQNTKERPETTTFTYFDDVTEQGGLGDPTSSDPEAVAEIVDKATADILDALGSDIEDGW